MSNMIGKAALVGLIDALANDVDTMNDAEDIKKRIADVRKTLHDGLNKIQYEDPIAVIEVDSSHVKAYINDTDIFGDDHVLETFKYDLRNCADGLRNAMKEVVARNTNHCEKFIFYNN